MSIFGRLRGNVVSPEQSEIEALRSVLVSGDESATERVAGALKSMPLAKLQALGQMSTADVRGLFERDLASAELPDSTQESLVPTASAEATLALHELGCKVVRELVGQSHEVAAFQAWESVSAIHQEFYPPTSFPSTAIAS